MHTSRPPRDKGSLGSVEGDVQVQGGAWLHEADPGSSHSLPLITGLPEHLLLPHMAGDTRGAWTFLVLHVIH